MSDEHLGRVALVTGAAGDGIGQATARRLAGDGATVALVDLHEGRSARVAEELQREFGPQRAQGFVFDVSDRAAVDRGLEQIYAQLGPVDILVNNAALNIRAPLREYDPADWDRVQAAVSGAAFYLIRRNLPQMMERGWGAIVNVSSSASFYANSDLEGAYASAKAAVNALTRAVALEGGPHGVRCNAVAPGLVLTRFIRTQTDLLDQAISRTPLRRVAEPGDIANVIAFLCSEQSAYVTGEIIGATGGSFMRA